MNVNDVRVGQEVAYGYFHWSTLLYHGRSRVTKINGHGRIVLEDGTQFDRHGVHRPVAPDSYSTRARLMTVEAYDAHLAERAEFSARRVLTGQIICMLEQNSSTGFTDEQKWMLQDKIARL